ncbi:hypothetical protein M9H77_17439 [Catharanthus roseus]|uniref:Uncharacterized protein n=1 Tax=Catharanthus roseus TaxID=4058 RepID=A0ACC0B4L7_CATRO|nr:hypothetical protein M9H77_17439 [Catharanthus roseus]
MVTFSPSQWVNRDRLALLKATPSHVRARFLRLLHSNCTRSLTQPTHVPSRSKNNEKERKWTKTDPSTKIQVPIARDYSQGYLELKKEEQSRTTNWGLIGAID